MSLAFQLFSTVVDRRDAFLDLDESFVDRLSVAVSP